MLPLVAAVLGPPAPPAEVTAAKAADAVDFRVGDGLAGRYRFAGTVWAGKGAAEQPLAKPFLWPLLAPGGVPVTRGWPVDRSDPAASTDHVHQKSVWFAHGRVEPDGGKPVNFWEENPGHGRQACADVGEPRRVSPAHVAVPTRNDWLGPDGTTLLTEERTVHLVALPAGRLWVFDIALTAAVPVAFGDEKDAGMAVRVPDAFRLHADGGKPNPGGGTVTSSGGKTAVPPAGPPAKDPIAVWGELADWHDYSGTVDGTPAGVAVFDHPDNRPRAAWHTRGYGLMAANPFGRGKSGFASQKGRSDLVRLAKGDRLALRYGVYAHAGDATSGKVAEAFRAFAGLPR